jgi:catechol 2,3-dioxygenase
MPMASPVGTRDVASIDSDTTLGTVRLTVGDLDRSRTFYERAIGLRPFDRDDGTIGLGINAQRPLVELRGDSSAPALNRSATGLYHLAILVPERRDLALAITRLAQARWPLDGASDHLVSEALYLSDPDGNGLEIYRDRPREQWRRTAGGLEMATLPLDLDGVMHELSSDDALEPLVPAGTTIGHVHLQVAELADTEAFYSGVLGFDVTVRGYPGALFVSAGGYHHHIGLNTWHSRGSGPAAQGAVGLRSFEVLLPNALELERVLDRVRGAGLPLHEASDGWLIRDPSGNSVVLRAPAT